MNIRHSKSGFRQRVYNLSKQGVAKIGILILCLCALITGCSPRDKAVVNTTKDESGATMKGFHLVETVNGKPQWELSGKNAETNQGTINIHNINCTFFQAQTGEVMLKVNSTKGILETTTRGIELVGKVIAEDSSKNIFYSSRLIWNAASSVLNSPEGITIQMKGAIFKADTLSINPDTQVIEAKGVRISMGGQPFNPPFDNEVQR